MDELGDLFEHPESGSEISAKQEKDQVVYEARLTSDENSEKQDSGSDVADSESSSIDESGFQKVKLNIDTADRLGSELGDSIGFQNVNCESDNVSTPEHEIVDSEVVDDFQRVRLEDGCAKIQEPDFNNTGEDPVHIAEEGDNVEVEEPYKNEEADVNDLDQENEEESSSHTSGFSEPGPSDSCTLRHRIAPEPARGSCSTDDHNFKDHEDDVTPKGSKEKLKIAQIRAALESNPVDIDSLRKLAISPGGLVNKNMRQRVWPLLINANTSNITPKPSQQEMEAMSKTYSQVVMDVNRSSSRFPPGIDDHVRMSMKDKLVDLIMRVMLKHRQLKYYQGFHDVCITFLLCMDEDLAFAMVEKLALGYMREYLDETMERTSLLLNFIYPLVNKCNPELCAHMERNGLGTIFALSWVITWFSHVLGDIKRILRVFDFFLASHRMMPVYLSAAFVLYREADIYAAGDEMGYIHKCLSTIPPDLPLESLLQRAGDLYLQYPPLEISNDPMLIRMNRQVSEHFNRIDNRTAARRAAQESSDRGRMFVKATLWAITAIVGIAAAVVYHSYMGQNWTFSDLWNS